jgi:hypothetical protein
MGTCEAISLEDMMVVVVSTNEPLDQYFVKENLTQKMKDFTDEHGDTMPYCQVTMARNYHKQ